MSGGGGNDDIMNDSFANIIGSSFNDTFVGTAGDNSFNGGAGIDTVDYTNVGAAVTVNLSLTAAQNTLGAGIDTFTGIENLTGSAYGDTLTGSSSVNVIIGGDGDDVIDGGLGNDTMDGGSGNDTVSFASFTTTGTTGIIASLANPGMQNTGFGNDIFTNFENILGSNYSDYLIGSGFADALIGGFGSDILEGYGGADVLIGGINQYDLNVMINSNTNAQLLQFSEDSNDAGFNTSAFARSVTVGTTLDLNNSIVSSAMDMLDRDASLGSLNSSAMTNLNYFSDQSLPSMRVEASLDTNTDIDLYKIYLNQGERVTFDIDTLGLNNNATFDSYLLIYDAGGVLRGFNDDAASDVGSAQNNSFLTYLAPSSGYYYLRVEAYSTAYQGDYQLNIQVNSYNQDVASYQGSYEAVTINLNQQGIAQISAGDANGDVLYGIHNVTGSAFSDTLLGNQYANTLTGGAGDDTLNGGGGDDQLIGGSGDDVFVFNQEVLSNDIVTDFMLGQDKLDLSGWTNISSAADLNITLLDTNADTVNDSMKITLDANNAVTLLNVTQLTDADLILQPVAPVNTVPGQQSVDEDTNLALGGLISVHDANGDLVSTELSVLNGTLTVVLSGAAVILAGSNGSNNLTISGSEAHINTTLATLIYRGNQDFNGADTLTVTSTDSLNHVDSDNVAITVNAVNDAPLFTSPASFNVNENTVIVGTVVASDADLPAQVLTYSIVQDLNDDAAFFQIDSNTGVLTFVNPPDFENPPIGGDNVYNVTVQVSDGFLTDTQALTVTVDNISITFTEGDDVIDFNAIQADEFSGSLYNALGGNDTVYLPNAANLAAFGYDPTNPFLGGAGDDTIIGAIDVADTIEGGAGADILRGFPIPNTLATLVSEGAEDTDFNQTNNPRGAAGNNNLAINDSDFVFTQVDRSAFGALTGSSLPNLEEFDSANIAPMFARLEGNIGAAGDIDVFKIHLLAGERLIMDVDTVNLTGPLHDTYIFLYDAGGNFIANNDIAPFLDVGSTNSVSQNSYLSYLASAEGDYYLRMEAFSTSVTALGAYRINLSLGVNDTLSYANSQAGVSVNLATNVVSGGDADGDSISGFVNVIGSGHNHVLIGDFNNNVLRGGAGDDSIDGGAGMIRLIIQMHQEESQLIYLLRLRRTPLMQGLIP